MQQNSRETHSFLKKQSQKGHYVLRIQPGLILAYLSSKIGSYSEPDLLVIMVNSNLIDLIESFTYFSRVQTSDGYCRLDITHRISIAFSAISSLNYM